MWYYKQCEYFERGIYMKKKNSWIFFVVAVILINVVAGAIPLFRDGGMQTLTVIVPVVGMFIFTASIIASAKNKLKETETDSEPLPKIEVKEEKEEPINTYATQKLYDEDSFKIDPKDYEI